VPVAWALLYPAGNAGGNFRRVCGWTVRAAVEAVGFLAVEEGGEGGWGKGLLERAGETAEGLTQDMSRIEEIEDAIDRLGPEEFRRIAGWVREREQQRWDKQLDGDASSGELDFLFEEAEEESKERLLRDWPPSK